MAEDRDGADDQELLKISLSASYTSLLSMPREGHWADTGQPGSVCGNVSMMVGHLPKHGGHLALSWPAEFSQN